MHVPHGRVRRDPRWPWRVFVVASSIGLFTNASGNDPLPPGSVDGSAEIGDGRRAADVVIDVTAEAMPIDSRLLGTNVPAWIGPERLADPQFQAATVESGVSLLRMPGGSWSTWYDWAACEVSDPARCPFVGSARPTDFIDFMQATDLPGMWTLSINQTAQSAAAAIAFFNGDVDDARPIGVDRHGVDWATVGSWARLRASGGNPAPQRIELWEVGNEVFGGKPETGGEQCASFGWEDVWTCDGAEYVNGDADHDGFLAIRAAMVEVDPTIQVGAVGVSDASEWSNWGNEVIDGARDDMDFYVVHAYGFDQSPSGESAVRRPVELWPGLVEDARRGLGADVPLALTEYNLVSFEAGDTEQSMTRAMNALYIADTIGQLATSGVEIANQWNLGNGTTGSGTDYGMISMDDGTRFPQYEAMAMWGRAGSSLLPADFDDDDLRVYATRHDDGRLSVLVFNLSGEEMVRTVRLTGDVIDGDAQLSSVWAGELSDQTMSSESSSIPIANGWSSLTLRPWSMNELKVSAP